MGKLVFYFEIELEFFLYCITCYFLIDVNYYNNYTLTEVLTEDDVEIKFMKTNTATDFNCLIYSYFYLFFPESEPNSNIFVFRYIYYI